jgi:hypothetical protein
MAQKGNSPFIGIACGVKTVLIKRTVFKQSLRGLRIVDAELVTGNEGTVQGQYQRLIETKTGVLTTTVSYGEPCEYQATHAIRVYAAGKGVKAVRLFLHQNPREYKNLRLLHEWQKAELKKRLPTGQKMDKYQKKIATLENKLAKLGKLHRPDNPAISPEREPESDGTRRHEHEWYLQKKTRRAVMALVLRTGWKHPHRTQVTADLTTTKLYAEVAKLRTPHYVCLNAAEVINWTEDNKPDYIYAIEDSAVTVTKWGEITANERDRKKLDDIWEYLARLWEFCHLTSKPLRITFTDTPEYLKNHWGPERYNRWQAERDARREITLMIAAIKEEREKQ